MTFHKHCRLLSDEPMGLSQIGQVRRTMATALGVFLLALPFLIVGGLVAALTYVLGTRTVRKRE